MSVEFHRAPSLRDRKYHIYVLYTRHDQDQVLCILQFLQGYGYKIFDPLQHEAPGSRKFESLKKNGMDSSRVFLVFLSKQFHKNRLIRFEVEQVIFAMGITPGRHRMITVMLKSCKIPHLLRGTAETCVFAWRYDQEADKVNRRVIKALQAQHSLVRGKRIQKFLNGRSKTQQDQGENRLNEMTTLLNFRQVTRALNSCFLSCQNEGCTFRCDGTDFFKFGKHINECNFRVLTCDNTACHEAIQKQQLGHHLKTCPSRPVRCSMEGCGKIVPISKLKDHEKVCQHQLVCCPYKKRGCKSQFVVSEKINHLTTCGFVPKECPTCKQKFKQTDLPSHFCQEATEPCVICKHPVKRKDTQYHIMDCSVFVSCSNEDCTSRVRRGELPQHLLACPFTFYECPNHGCGFRARRTLLAGHTQRCIFQTKVCQECGTSVVLRDLSAHQSECYRLIECDRCGMQISSSSKTTHDEWLCPMKSFFFVCDKCSAEFTHGDFKSHRLCHVQIEEDRNKIHCNLSGQKGGDDDESSKTESNSQKNRKGDDSLLMALSLCNAVKGDTPEQKVHTILSQVIAHRQKEPKVRTSSDSEWSYPHIRISPEQRQRVREVYRIVDTNKEHYRRCMSVN